MIRKTVIITGASGGIGSEIALKFAKNGYNIGITYNNNKANILEKQIKDFGVECLSLHMDLCNKKEIEDVFKKFYDYFKTIDVVVANAGISEKEEMLIDKDYEEISKMIDVNLKGTILTNKEACKYFIKQKKGVIVNVSSILGIKGCSCEVCYSASKAGVIGLTKALSKEVGEFGIRVNCVAPGMIDTKMIQVFSEEEKENLKNQTSLQRIGKPCDVANLVYFLSTEESSFITGECIEISGGLLI